MDVSEPGWSVGELTSLAAKAAVGAGLPWGIAEDAANIARQLCHWGLPAAEAIVADLASDEPGRTLTLACALSDGASPDVLSSMTGAFVPLLIAPALARQLEDENAVVISDAAGTDRLHVWRSGAVHLSGPNLSAHGPLDLRSAAPGEPAARLHRFPTPDPATCKILTGFAHRTYAPATEQSRMAGAGAGLLDND
ncbi:MAG: DUF3726 domain-containing protein [Pseudomonadota bacterium]